MPGLGLVCLPSQALLQGKAEALTSLFEHTNSQGIHLGTSLPLTPPESFASTQSQQRAHRSNGRCF